MHASHALLYLLKDELEEYIHTSIHNELRLRITFLQAEDIQRIQRSNVIITEKVWL